MNRFLLAGLGMVLCTVAFAAGAQEERAQDTGLRLGTHGKLHGTFEMIHTYDSNAMYSYTNSTPDYVLQLIPGANLEWITRKMELNTGYRFTARENMKYDVQDDLGHLATGRARYHFSRRISAGVEDEFEITSDPADLEIPERLGRTTNEASADVLYETPGKDLDFDVKYTNTYRAYDAALSDLSYYDNKVSLTSRVNVSSHFRFLPKTVLFGTFEYGNHDFRDDPEVLGSNNDSQGIDILLGLRSQFSRKLGAEISAGTTVLLFDQGPDGVTVTGGVGVTYVQGRMYSVSARYTRDSNVSTFTNFWNEDRLDFDWMVRLLRKFHLDSKTLFAFLDFSGPTMVPPDASERKDFVIQSQTGLTYDFRSWVSFCLEYWLDYRDSNATDPVTGYASADFLKHQVNASAKFYY